MELVDEALGKLPLADERARIAARLAQLERIIDTKFEPRQLRSGLY